MQTLDERTKEFLEVHRLTNKVITSLGFNVDTERTIAANLIKELSEENDKLKKALKGGLSA